MSPTSVRFLPAIMAGMLLWASALCPGRGEAQTPSDQGPELPLEEVEVTAARVPETLARTAADVTVITRAQLEQQQITTVADALRMVPALNVVESGTPGSVTSVFARGGNSDHTLVLIDGVRVNSPTTGMFDFANLTTAGVERIEVVRGPSSALYGSEGLTAVINIITRKGEGTPQGGIETEAGSYQTFRERGWSAGAAGPLRYSVDVARDDSSGKFAHDEYNNTAAAARLDAEVLPTLSLDLSARYTDAFKNLPGVTGRTDFLTGQPDATQSNREGLTTVSLGATHTPTDWWSHRLQLSYVEDDVDFRDPQEDQELAQGLLTSSATGKTHTTRLAADWQHNLRPVSWDALTLGMQVEQAKGDQTDVSGATVLNKTFTNYAFYGQNQVTVWDRLILTAGLREDDYSTFGSHLSPKYSVAYLLPETNSKLRASYGEGFHAPTINDLAYPGFSNPNLKPEQNRSLEFGVDQSLWTERILASLTWFQSRFRDLIQYDYATSKPENIAHARTQGVEAALTIRPGYGLNVVAGYTYLESLDDNGQPLLRRPENSWNFTVNYAPLKRVNLYSTLLYVGKRADTDPVTYADAENYKYVTWGAGASVTILERAGFLRNLRAHGKLDNILGVHYQEALGFPALGRRYTLGLSGEF